MNRDERPPDPRTSPPDPETTPELEGISPLNPRTFPRAEDDEETLAHSPEFHDIPDPGPNVGRGNPSRHAGDRQDK
jgi:hypothetical protein